MEGKRQVHPALKKLLAWDAEISKKFVSFLLNFVQVRSFARHCKVLEWSCNGVVWLVGWLAFTYMIDNKSLYQMQINMFVALIFDIVCVAVIKAIVRRRRPSVDPYAYGPDIYSFPSGHASRSTMLLCFFTLLSPFSIVFWPPILAWTTSICMSRLLLYRHHILDVIAGVFLGLFEACFLAIIWLDQETCESVMKWMTDESNTGPEV